MHQVSPALLFARKVEQLKMPLGKKSFIEELEKIQGYRLGFTHKDETFIEFSDCIVDTMQTSKFNTLELNKILRVMVNLGVYDVPIWRALREAFEEIAKGNERDDLHFLDNYLQFSYFSLPHHSLIGFDDNSFVDRVQEIEKRTVAIGREEKAGERMILDALFSTNLIPIQALDLLIKQNLLNTSLPSICAYLSSRSARDENLSKADMNSLQNLAIYVRERLEYEIAYNFKINEGLFQIYVHSPPTIIKHKMILLLSMDQE